MQNLDSLRIGTYHNTIFIHSDMIPYQNLIYICIYIQMYIFVEKYVST